MIETALAFITPTHLALVPVIIGLVEVIKRAGVSTVWAPATSIVIGIALSAVIGGGAASIIVGGIIVGLMASGLYSGTSTMMKKA